MASKVTADGHIEWVQGDLGDMSLVKLEYQNYHAMDWTIIASSSGTCFTNDRTGHGMFVSVETCPRSDQDYSRQADVLHLSATSN